MGLCGGFTAWLPVGPLVAAGRMSRAKSNHFPVPRMFCLPQRKIKRAGRGKKVDPCGNASVCLSATASLCPSAFLPLSVCLDLLFSVSQCLYPRLSLLCLCFSMSASISLSRSLCFSLSLSLLFFFLFPSSLSPPFLSLLPF